MPLQIRRGTNAERTDSTFTPAEGELIYTTDTKKLYVGDGVTPGGVAIDTVGDDSTISGVGGATTINELSDVIIEDPSPGDVLKWDGVNWTADIARDIISLDDLLDVIIENPVPGGILKYDGSNWTIGEDTGGGANTLNDLLDVFIENPVPGGSMLTYDGSNWVASNDDISITGDIFANIVYGDTEGDHFGDVIADDSTTRLVDATLQKFTGSLVGDVTGNVTGDVTGNVTGDLKGSVFGDDSTIIVDSVNKVLRVSDWEPINGAAVIAATNLISTVNIISANDTIDPNTYAQLDLRYTSLDNTIDDIFTRLSRVAFSKEDANGIQNRALITGYESGLAIVVQNPSTNAYGDERLIWIDGETGGIVLGGSGTPNAKLDVRGSGIFEGFIQFGSYTDAEILSVTPANGMVYYNTTDNRFRGYQNGAWINLDDGTAV